MRHLKTVAIIMVAILAAFFVATVASPAQAQEKCAPLDEFLQAAADSYQEIPVVIGVGLPTEAMPDGHMLIIMASPEGTWTALVVAPNKTACMVDAGDGFRLAEALKQGSL